MDFTEAWNALSPSLPPGSDREHHRVRSWGFARCDEIADPQFRYLVFEIAARQGYDIAFRLLHQALDDGISGPEPVDMQALAFVHDVDPERLYARLVGAWLLYLFEQPEWRTVGNHWARRLGIYLLAL